MDRKITHGRKAAERLARRWFAAGGVPNHFVGFSDSPRFYLFIHCMSRGIVREFAVPCWGARALRREVDDAIWFFRRVRGWGMDYAEILFEKAATRYGEGNQRDRWEWKAANHIRELEATLKNALDYIDDPAESERKMMGPQLIVQAGRRLLYKRYDLYKSSNDAETA